METASLSLAQPQTFGSTEETARGIAPILKQGFGLPLPKRVNVFVYLGRLAFERGLVVEEGLSQARAAELSDFAIGIAGRRQLLLNQGGYETHGTPQGLASWRRREGTLPTYQLAFLMADYLIERRGLGGVEARFRSFSSSRDRNKNFALAFGTTLAEFEKDMLSHVVAAPAAGPPSDQRQVARTPRAAHCPGSVPQPAVELWMNGTCMRKKLGHPGPQLLGT